MNWRQAVLLPARAYVANTVETIDLSLSECISDINIIYRGTNGNDTPVGHGALFIARCEVLDGSDIIASLDGTEMLPLHFYHYQKPPSNTVNYIGGNQWIFTASIPFGRWLYDPLLSLDPKRFKNPQIRVTILLAGGGSNCAAGSLEVCADVFADKKVAPIGFLRNYEWYRYALVANGFETVELTTDEIIKAIMVQSYFPTRDLNAQMAQVRISEDNDRNIVLDNNMTDLLKVLNAEYGPYFERWRGHLTAGAVNFFWSQCMELDVTMTDIIGLINYYGSIPLGGGSMSLRAQIISNVGGLAWGTAPMGALWIPTGDQWDLEDWYDPTRLKRLALRIQGGAAVGAGSVGRVILQTMRKY